MKTTITLLVAILVGSGGISTAPDLCTEDVITDPTTGQVQENLPAVKQTIDILAMLKEKTLGNLDAEEEKLMDQLIYELQMKYVAKQNKQPEKT